MTTDDNVEQKWRTHTFPQKCLTYSSRTRTHVVGPKVICGRPSTRCGHAVDERSLIDYDDVHYAEDGRPLATCSLCVSVEKP